MVGMKKRRVKVALLRMGFMASSPAVRQDIRYLLRNSDALDTFVYVIESYSGPDDTYTISSLADLFQWFLDNWEAIYEIIKVIIDLFGGAEVSNDQ